MEPPPPTQLCLRCRALLDGHGCDCSDAGALVRLDEPGAAAAIDEAILFAPSRDALDIVARLGFGFLAGPGLVALLFVAMGLVVFPALPELETFWPYVFGIPLSVGTVAWSAFVVASTLREPPYYLSRERPPPRPGERLEARLARGVVVHGAELRSPRDREGVILRDAWAAEPLVLVRPGERIEVPAGRLRLDAPPARWRAGPGWLQRSWTSVPPSLRRGGPSAWIRLEEGDVVGLVGAELEELDRVEAGFRGAADRRFRVTHARARIEVPE